MAQVQNELRGKFGHNFMSSLDLNYIWLRLILTIHAGR